MVVSRKDRKLHRQATFAGSLRVARGLAPELRQFASSHEHPQRRTAIAQDAQRAERLHLGAIERELFIEIVERNGLKVKNSADRNAAANGGMPRSHGGEMSARRPPSHEQPIA